MRAWFDPEFQWDDPVDPGEGWWAVPAFRRLPNGRGLVVQGAHRHWVHVAGLVTGFPPWTVPASLLDEVVTAADAPIRTVVTTWQPIPVRRAIHTAQALSANAQAAQGANLERGSVSTGEAEDRQDAATWLLRDLRSGSAGVGVTVRILVSGEGVRAASHGRDAIERALTPLGMRIEWDDRDHARGMVACLPICAGMKEVKR